MCSKQISIAILLSPNTHSVHTLVVTTPLHSSILPTIKMSDTTHSLDNIEEIYETMISEYRAEEKELAEKSMKNNDAIEDTQKSVESKSSKRLVRRNIHRRNSHNTATAATATNDDSSDTKEKANKSIESSTKGKIALFEDKLLGRRTSQHRTVSSSSSKY